MAEDPSVQTYNTVIPCHPHTMNSMSVAGYVRHSELAAKKPHGTKIRRYETRGYCTENASSA